MSQSLNPKISQHIADNPRQFQKACKRAREIMEQKGVPPQDADDAVGNAYASIISKPCHEASFESEGRLTPRRMLKVSVQELRDMLDKRGRDGDGRAHGSRIRKEVSYDDILAQIPTDEHHDVPLPLSASCYKQQTDMPVFVPQGAGETDGGYKGTGNDCVMTFTNPHQPSPEDLYFAKEMAEEFAAIIEDWHHRDPASAERYLDHIEKQVEGYGRNELAEMDGISKNTMASRLTLVRKKLLKAECLRDTYLVELRNKAAQ